MALGKSILILNGPNLNRLGLREPEIYGHVTLKDLEKNCIQYADNLGLKATCFQSNDEGQMLTKIHDHAADAIIINPAAWGHTSIALRDALLSVAPSQLYEVHISNIYKRESFRHFTYISDIATGVICGFGIQGYFAAIDAISNNNKNF